MVRFGHPLTRHLSKIAYFSHLKHIASLDANDALHIHQHWPFKVSDYNVHFTR